MGKMWVDEMFLYIFCSWEISGKVYGKSMEHGDSPISIGIRPRRNAVLPARDNLTKLQGIMVVSNKKRGLTSKSRAVTNKRGTLYPKKMLAGDGCKYRTNEFDTHHLRKLRSNKTQTMQHIFIELNCIN